MPLGPSQLEAFIPVKHQSIIWAQARVAFLKINKSASVDLEDLFSIGLEIYFISLPKWNKEKNKSLESYITLCLKSRYVQVVRDTFAKKRGGAGCKSDDIRLGRGDKWKNGEIPSMFHHISIDTCNEDKEIDIPSDKDNDFEYDMLTDQISKFIPKKYYNVYKQLISPDDDLKDIIVNKYKGKDRIGNKKNNVLFNIDNEVISEYLNMKIEDVKNSRNIIGNIVKEKLGITL